jgi:hypothetical protein
MSGVVPWICVRKGTEASQSHIPGAKRSFQVIKLSNLSNYPYDSMSYIFISVEVSTSNGKSYNLTKEVVLAMITKGRRNEASILSSFSISKRNELAYSRTCKDRSKANHAYSTP